MGIVMETLQTVYIHVQASAGQPTLTVIVRLSTLS